MTMHKHIFILEFGLYKLNGIIKMFHYWAVNRIFQINPFMMPNQIVLLNFCVHIIVAVSPLIHYCEHCRNAIVPNDVFMQTLYSAQKQIPWIVRNRIFLVVNWNYMMTVWAGVFVLKTLDNHFLPFGCLSIETNKTNVNRFNNFFIKEYAIPL